MLCHAVLLSESKYSLLFLWSLPRILIMNNENDRPPAVKLRKWLMRNKESTLPGLKSLHLLVKHSWSGVQPRKPRIFCPTKVNYSYTENYSSFTCLADILTKHACSFNGSNCYLWEFRKISHHPPGQRQHCCLAREFRPIFIWLCPSPKICSYVPAVRNSVV